MTLNITNPTPIELDGKDLPNQDITMVDLFPLEDLKDQMSMRNESVAYYYSTYLLPDMPLACRAATKVLHFCLSFAIFSTVPQVLFMVFISPSTVRLHVFFGLPRLRFPSAVQCSAVLVMEFLSFLITCPIHFQRLLNNIVAIFSFVHCLSRSSLYILFGQKMCRILLKLLV